jgi:CRP-like cAMP-binding protein
MTLSVFGQGILSASSLAIGALVGVFSHPTKKISAAIMAFGSGTLISAIAFEITLSVYEKSNFWFLVLGFTLGGFFFVSFSQYIDEHGGFLRQHASSRRYLMKYSQGKKDQSTVLERLSQVEVVQQIPKAEKDFLATYLTPVFVEPGHILCQEGDLGDYFYLIIRGEAEVRRKGNFLRILREGDIFGEMSLLTGEPRSATVLAKTPMELYQLNQENFVKVLRSSPHLAWALSRNLARRLQSSTDSRVAAEKNLSRWKQQLMEEVEINQILAEDPIVIENLVKNSTPLAILVGTLLDNIPESAIIGINAANNQLSWSFLVAVFISNFPEALSSASGMLQAGTKKIQILGLWFGIVLLSGFGAVAGYTMQNIMPQQGVALTEAIAGGAILAMLASTMMPEAYELGGSSVAYCTIAGFLLSFLISSVNF